MRIASRPAAALLAALTFALLGLAAGEAAAQSPFGDFGLGQSREEAAPEVDRPPDLEAYGSIAESYRASSALENTERQVARLREGIIATVSRAPHVLEDARRTLSNAAPTGDPSYFLGILAFLGFLLGLGRAVGMLAAVYIARPIFVGMQRADPQGVAEKLPVLAARVGLMIGIVAVTILVAVLVGSGFYPEDDQAAVVTALIVFAGYAIWRLTDVVFRMMLAPFLPAYRIPELGDRDARRIYRWLSGLLIYRLLTHGVLLWLDQLGLTATTSALLHLVATAIEIAVVLAGGWVNRVAIRNAVLGGRSPREASWLARGAAILWGPALIVFLLVAWVDRARVLVLGADTAPPPPVTAVLAAALAGFALYIVIAFVVELISRRRHGPPARREEAAADGSAGSGAGEERVAPSAEPPAQIDAAPASDPTALRDRRADGGDGGDDGGDEEGGGRVFFAEDAKPSETRYTGALRSYSDLARRVASLFAIGTALYTLAMLSAGRALLEQEDGVLNRLGDVLDILFVGYIVYHLIRIWIDRRIEEEGGDEELEAEPGDEGGGASAQSRLATLLPLVRNFVLALVLASTGVFLAMEVGVNVAPLFAGAGVVGLAIGFGAQTLVRDILSGAFFLIDDAFRKGEYIDIGDVKGTVEKISVRSFQLRHHLGALNTVPFGEVRFLTNFSRDWVMMKLPLRLTYDTDPEKVRKLVKKLGQQLLSHETEGHKFLQPLKSQGVYMMEDSAMIIRVKYMTRPGDQWTTRKLVYSSIRELFEREGIRFAHREVTVRIPELDQRGEQGLSDPEMRAVGAAARRAVDDAEAAAGPRPVAVGDDR